MIAVLGSYHGGTSAAMANLELSGVNIGTPDTWVSGSKDDDGPGYQCYENKDLQKILKKMWKEGPMTERVNYRERVRLLKIWAESNPSIDAVKHPLLCLMVREIKEVWPNITFLRIERPFDDVVNALYRDGGFFQGFYEVMTRELIRGKEMADTPYSFAYSSPDFAQTIQLFGAGVRSKRAFQLFRERRMKADVSCDNHNKPIGLAKFILEQIPEQGRYIEIGTCRGVSTEMVAVLRPDLIIETIDIKPKRESFERLKPYENVTQHTANGIGYAETIPDKSLDAVYIDADHSYGATINQIKAWTPKVKAGGIVAGHDYWLKFNGVIRAATDHFKQPPHGVYSDTSWFYRL